MDDHITDLGVDLDFVGVQRGRILLSFDRPVLSGPKIQYARFDSTEAA